MTMRDSLLMGVLVTLSAVFGSASASDAEPGLVDRVQSYWDGRVQRDWQTTYALEKDAHGDESINPYQYYRRMERRGRAHIARYRLLSIDQQEGHATAAIEVRLIPPISLATLPLVRTYESKWELVDESWLHVKSKMVGSTQQGRTPDETE
jgi:hypothetical protein